MLRIIERIAAIGRAVLGIGTASGPEIQQPATNPQSEVIHRASPVGAAAAYPMAVCNVPIKVTISQPEPIVTVDRHAVVSADDVRPELIAPNTPAVAKRATTLRSMRHAVSPIAMTKAAGALMARPPRRAKTATRRPVRVNRVSGDSVRMQAALMRSKRLSDAERALAKLKALRPTATIHALHRAA